MDLPTCPSCGQSVLDDDATECPFCGASMSGKPKAGGSGAAGAGKAGAAQKSGAGKASGDDRKGASSSGARRRRAKDTVSDDEDPFDLSSGAVATNAIAARPRPSKGRLHRVICPMCETPGFVPKSAVGKQVRCANPDCLVPVFTAPGGNTPGDTRSRTSDADVAASAGDGIAPSAGSPMKIYVIAAVVLFPLAGLLIFFLNRSGGENPDLDRPADIDWSAIQAGGTDEEAAGNSEQTAAESGATVQSPQEVAQGIVKRMISAARLEQNRDKAQARRMTADAYIRLGMQDEATQELGQLIKVSRQVSSGRTFLQVEPQLTEYWARVEQGDTAGAKKTYQEVLAEAKRLTSPGRLALETLIGAAAAAMNESDPETAKSLVSQYDRDQSVMSNRDVLDSAAWFQSAARLRDAGLEPFTVGDVFAWEDALKTGVAVDLATHGKWDAATQWSVMQSELRCVSDSLAAVAEIACRSQAGAAVLGTISAAGETAGPAISLRVKSVIAGQTNDAELLESCQQQLAAVSIPAAAALPSLTELVRSSSRDFDMQPRLMAAAAAEFARAAVLLGDEAGAQLGIRHLYGHLSSIVAATPVVRRAILELEQSESRVKRRIGDELRISSSSEIASQFRKYRRVLDQYAVAAERRRLYLMQRLARIVRAGGTNALLAVMEDESIALKQEVVMDELARLLAAAAARRSEKLPPIEQPDSALIVKRPTRMDAMPEATLSNTLVVAWSAADAGRLREAVRSLNSGRNLPGFREALLNEIIEDEAVDADDPTLVYAAIGDVSNPVWREEALQIASRVFARRGKAAEVETWLDGERVPPTELVAAYYGLVLGLLERQPAGVSR